MIATSVMYAVPVDGNVFENIILNLPKEYRTEEILTNKISFPRISIIRPTFSRSSIDIFLSNSKYLEFLEKIRKLENLSLQTTKTYTYFDVIENSTYICLGFEFADLGNELTANFLKMREDVYEIAGINSPKKNIPLHLTISEVKGKLELPSMEMINNFSLEIMFSPKIFEKHKKIWTLIE